MWTCPTCICDNLKRKNESNREEAMPLCALLYRVVESAQDGAIPLKEAMCVLVAFGIPLESLQS